MLNTVLEYFLLYVNIMFINIRSHLIYFLGWNVFPQIFIFDRLHCHFQKEISLENNGKSNIHIRENVKVLCQRN